MIRIEPIGIPAPKGSSRAMMVGGKDGFGGPAAAVNVPSGSDANKRSQKSWSREVIDACLPFSNLSPDAMLEGPLACAMIYRMPRRKSDAASAKRVADGIKHDAPFFTSVAPDADKICRCTWDAITMSGRIWTDDAQVALAIAGRVYVPPGGMPGATILIARAAEWRTCLDEFTGALAQLESETDWCRAEPARKRSA